MASAAHRLHTITLELLRSGLPHNQLLSTLTEYLALCGNHGATPVHVPYNHAEYENRIKSFFYPMENHSDIHEVSEKLRDMLSLVPGLSPGLAEAVGANRDMTHLQLVLTPHELALLPFECCYVPRGAPGAPGQHLLLQADAPVSLTRAVRGVTGEHVQWPVKPKILFAWAAPPNVGNVPFEQNLLALRQALTPWIFPYRGESNKTSDKQEYFRRETERYLTLLPNASIDDIYNACSKTAYTHVHILAHGIAADSNTGHKKVGLALYNTRRRGQSEAVDGMRLANALRFREPQDNGRSSLPAVVTLASCGSGNTGSVITHGASLAHELHSSGIPFVVASQFPLSIAGSVVMTEELYKRLLQAEDPCVALHYVRRRLFSKFKDNHDWVSIVAYAALPSNLESQLTNNQFQVVNNNIHRVLDEADALLDRTPTKQSKTYKINSELDVKGAEQQLNSKLDQLKGLEKELLCRGSDKTESLILVASTAKRRAEILYWASDLKEEAYPHYGFYRERSLDALMQARKYYYQATCSNFSNHWPGVQYLSLTRVLLEIDCISGSFPEELWTVVKLVTEKNLDKCKDDAELAWAYASLAELCLIRVRPDQGLEKFEELALEHVRKMRNLVERDSFILYSTRRQFARYVDWWEKLQNSKGETIVLTSPVAKELVRLLPKPNSLRER